MNRRERDRKAVQDAELKWRSCEKLMRDSKRKRDRAIRKAHASGIGYGQIGKWLGVHRSLIAQICQEDR
jgi:hypothetical protein